jgi:hypothetical protein
MSHIRNKALVTTMATSLLVMAWLGVSIHGSGLAGRELRAFSMRPSSETGFRVMTFQYDRGLLSSTGSFELQQVTVSSDDQGNGTTALPIEKFSTGQSTFEGFRHAARVVAEEQLRWRKQTQE